MRIILVTNKTNSSIAEVRLDDDLKKGSINVLESSVNKDLKSYSRVKLLSRIIDTLKEFDQIDEEERKTKEIVIYTLSLFSDAVNKNFFKAWIRNNGKKRSGGEIGKTELELWKEFSRLYSKHLLNFEFRDCSDITKRFSGNVKYKKINEQFTNNSYYITLNGSIQKAWDMLKPEDGSDSTNTDSENSFFSDESDESIESDIYDMMNDMDSDDINESLIDDSEDSAQIFK